MPAVIRPFRGIFPKIHPTAFVAETAVIIGDVVLGADSSVWHGCVLRGDVQRIVIGEGSNIQDGSVLHEESDAQGGDYRESGGGLPVLVGRGVTVGHKVLLHACSVGDGALVGMGSIVLDGACIEAGGYLAAGALLTPGKVLPTGELWGGSPARLMRPLSDAEKAFLAHSAERYVRLARAHRDEAAEPAPNPTHASVPHASTPL